MSSESRLRRDKDYTFVKDYKHDDKLRLSFCSLAKQTFGIDIEPWYRRGFWNENYICYSFECGGAIVSNVSLNTMRLIQQGREREAVQIGTVMTHPEHRRKGLAKRLMETAMQDYRQRYGFLFLEAAKDAAPLYSGCGFEPVLTRRYVIDLSGYRRAEEPLTVVNVSAEELLSAKRRSMPLSQTLSAIGDEHILMFYYMHGFSSKIYRPWTDTYAIYETKEDALHIYDIISPRRIRLEELLERIAPENIREAVCCFTPDEDTKGAESMPDTAAGWMALGGTFPEDSCFPRISQA